MKNTSFAFFFILCCVLFPALAHAYTDEVNGSTIDVQQYKSSFFLLDLYQPDSLSKLQISFKVPIIRDSTLFMFGFTQQMFWQLRGKTMPFYDINYNPELFMTFYFGSSKKVGLDIGLIEHESNGIDGPRSVASERSYLRFFQKWDMPNGSSLYLNVKMSALYLLDSQSMDLGRSRGLWEINFAWLDFANCSCFTISDMNLRLYSGGPSMMSPLDGAIEYTARIKTKVFDVAVPMFVIQFFLGRAECLIDYRKPPEFTFRFGVGF